MPAAIARPNPVPPGLVVKNGSKIRPASSIGIPGPGIGDPNHRRRRSRRILVLELDPELAFPLPHRLERIPGQVDEYLLHRLAVDEGRDPARRRIDHHLDLDLLTGRELGQLANLM